MRWAIATAFVLILALTALLWREGALDGIRDVLMPRRLPPTETPRLAGPSPPSVETTDEARLVRLEVPQHRPNSELSHVFLVDHQDESVESAVIEPASPQPKAGQKAAAQRVKVQTGDTLWKLAMAIYGRADREVLQLVKKANPTLSDNNRIRMGQVLIFPPLQDPVQHTDGKEVSLRHEP